jgi:hypothetical protein
VPVLFYALCAVLPLAQYVSPFFVMGAWLYVALRYIHSFIHLTYNRVAHRFAVYALSTVILWVLWEYWACKFCTHVVRLTTRW